MALYNKREFSVLCGIETKNLSVYISRKKVVLNENDLIDDKNQINAAFIIKASAKIENKSVDPVVYEAKVIRNTPKNTEEQEEDNENLSIAALDRKKLELDIEKKQADLEKVVLSNSRAKGEVIPFGLIKPLITQNNQSLTTEFKNAADGIILEIAKKKDLSSIEVAELNGVLVSVINNAIRKATELSIKNLDIIIEDYKSTIK